MGYSRAQCWCPLGPNRELRENRGWSRRCNGHGLAQSLRKWEGCVVSPEPEDLPALASFNPPRFTERAGPCKIWAVSSDRKTRVDLSCVLEMRLLRTEHEKSRARQTSNRARCAPAIARPIDGVPAGRGRASVAHLVSAKSFRVRVVQQC